MTRVVIDYALPEAFDLIHPDVVHIMKKGKIVKTGDKSLASTIGGFDALG